MLTHTPLAQSWFDQPDMGVKHLEAARAAFKEWITFQLEEPGGDVQSIIIDPFGSYAIGCMAYWEAYMAFMIEQPLDSVDYLTPFAQITDAEQVRPHPWTGIGTPAFILLAQTGILVRHQRMLVKLGWASSTDSPMMERLFERAMGIEEICLKFHPADKQQMMATGDSRTGHAELDRLAWIYKLVTLLELYKSFPGLGNRYIRNRQSGKELASTTGDPGTGALGSLYNAQAYKRLLFDITSSILSLVEETGFSSPICRSLSLALVISGSVLQSSLFQKLRWPSNSSTIPDLGLESVAARPYVMQKWRRLVIDELQTIARHLAIVTYQQVPYLMQRFWEQMDSEVDIGCSRLRSDLPHWIDVMEDLKLAVFFG